MQINNDKTVGINEDKAVRLIKYIVALESDNCKTNRSDDNEMVHKISKQIQGEVKCL